MKGEKRDLTVCDRNAKQESFKFTQHAWLLNREPHFQYKNLLIEPCSEWSKKTTKNKTKTAPYYDNHHIISNY